MEQRTEEWFAARVGKVTASNVDNVIVKVKNGESMYKRKYRTQLITEQLTGKPIKIFMNEAMRHGVEYEDEARNAYIAKLGLLKDVDVKEEGFVDHPTVMMSGASPDGMVGDEGLIEIKCPQATTHTEILQNAVIPKRYIHQMMWQMACTGRKWCDFVCYHPDFPDDYKLFIKRVERDDDLIGRLERDIHEFAVEVMDSVKFIKENN
tara:strand:+ start:215 stop:835 length:621 start_codon:yes stop_codon:yes gene_type:complete